MFAEIMLISQINLFYSKIKERTIQKVLSNFIIFDF